MPDGSDVFFHVSSLTPLGLSGVDQGDVLVCEIGNVPRGRQVTRILEVKQSTASAGNTESRPIRRDYIGDRPSQREYGMGRGSLERPPGRARGGERSPRREFSDGGFGGERPARRNFGSGGGVGVERPSRKEFSSRFAAPEGPSEIITGTVKFFDVRRGFGFIVPESGTDVFVPVRALGAVTPESLTPGRRVRATVVTGPKGRQALSVELL